MVSVGYEAGQHELFAEHVKTEIMKDIQNKSGEIHKMIKDNSKHAKKEKDKIDSSYLKLAKAKLKYQKSHHDWADAERSHRTADQDGKISRNEISRLKTVCETKHRQHETSLRSYGEQVDKTNAEQREYFECILPRVVNRLQELDRERMEFSRRVLERQMKEEMDMVEMINKCREGVEEAIASIDVDRDQNTVVER